jgi:lipoate-protein ligase A
MSAVRLLPWRVADGALNMALDESLLASAIEGVASLRFYGWSAAALSLGYFQPHGPARAMPRLAPLDWVRRPTGGLALVHHLEITYALALPASARSPACGSWLVAFHAAIRDVLAGIGVTARLCHEPRPPDRFGEVLCFLHHTPGDVILDESKVVGSAQRRGRGATLQHGSILLRQSPHTPDLPGIAELSGRDLSREELCDALVAEASRQFRWDVRADEWTPDEERHAAELSASRYRTAAWNERR